MGFSSVQGQQINAVVLVWFMSPVAASTSGIAGCELWNQFSPVSYCQVPVLRFPQAMCSGDNETTQARGARPPSEAPSVLGEMMGTRW